MAGGNRPWQGLRFGAVGRDRTVLRLV